MTGENRFIKYGVITFPKLIDVHVGDAKIVLASLAENRFHSCITSPPYFALRNYDIAGQLGQEDTVANYLVALVDVFRAVRRVLRDDGTLWVNLGDAYTQKRLGSLAPKNLLGLPWRLALALQDDGWILRSDIIWEKPNAMPTSVQDRPTTSHEHIFLFAKSSHYYYDIDAIREPFRTSDAMRAKLNQPPIRIRNVGGRTDGFTRTASAMSWPIGGRNKRTVWSVPTQPAYKGSHFAAYPPALIEPCVLASCPHGGDILDPFAGTGTTGLVAATHGRRATLVEINPIYAQQMRNRLGAFL